MSASFTAAKGYDAVVLLGFGGPSGPQEIRPFLDRVLNGRKIPPARYESVVGHYLEIGGRSPYNELTQRQAHAIARVLEQCGMTVPVQVAYRNAEPFVESVLTRLAQDGAQNVLGIVLAPHQGSAGWDKYVATVEEARQKIGESAPRVDYVDPYFDHPLFVQAHADRVKDALARLGRSAYDGVEVIFTAHSIPQTLAGSEIYVRQFLRSTELIARAAGLERWSIAYQSRSGSPNEPWLEPDVRDLIRELPARGATEAIVDPVGFLCDHVEVLYDLDIDAQNAARSAGVRMERASALNDHPLFVEMMAGLTMNAVRRLQTAQSQ